MSAPPRVGEWYRRPDRNEPFRVTAVDARSGDIDVEFRDGTLDEWPLSHWHALRPERAEPPQDGTRPFDSACDDADADPARHVDPSSLLAPLEAAQDEAERVRIERLADDVATLRRRHRWPAQRA